MSGVFSYGKILLDREREEKMLIIYVMLASTVLLTILFYYVFSNKVPKEEPIHDKEVSPVLEKIGDNVSLTKAILKFIGNEKTIVEQNPDEKAKISFFQPVKNKIIIRPTGDIGDISRLIHVSHECVHSVQPKKLLMAHFILSNIQLIYFIGIFAYFFYTNSVEIKTILLVIQLILFLGTIFIRLVLEQDASYRSINVATDFLTGKVSEASIKGFSERTVMEVLNILPIFCFSLFTQGATLLIIAQIGAILF